MLLGELSFISPSNQFSPSSLTLQTANALTIVWLHQTELTSGASFGLGTGIRQSISIHLPGWRFVVAKNLLRTAAQPEAWLVHPLACVAESDRVHFHTVGQRLFRHHSKETQVWFWPRSALTESSLSRFQSEPECRPQMTFRSLRLTNHHHHYVGSFFIDSIVTWRHLHLSGRWTNYTQWTNARG